VLEAGHQPGDLAVDETVHERVNDPGRGAGLGAVVGAGAEDGQAQQRVAEYRS